MSRVAKYDESSPIDVQRDDRDHPRDDPGRHEERQRRDRHHLERVDLLGDPHRAELGGEAAADGGGQRDAGTSGAISRVLK